MNKIDRTEQTDFISFFRSVRIYESHNLMKWSSQSQWSVELTDNEWTDNEWWWEQYDKQWWCDNDEDILWWQTMRIALTEDNENNVWQTRTTLKTMKSFKNENDNDNCNDKQIKSFKKIVCNADVIKSLCASMTFSSSISQFPAIVDIYLTFF